jgi:hypothetical protein
MHALVVSLNFNPGHFSHLVATYRLLAEAGYTPHLYVHPSFERMDEKDEFRKLTSARQLKALGPVMAAVFWFPSLRNLVEMLRLRLGGSRVAYVFHEPFDSIASYRRSGFSRLKVARITAISLINIPVLLLAQQVMLPSAVSLRLYRKRYLWLNGHFHHVPLLFDDEAAASPGVPPPKDCIAYIGTIAPDHAFDCFVDFAKAAIEQKRLLGHTFLIATRSDLPDREREILGQLAASGRLRVHAGRSMSTEEINEHFRRSLVVWNAYRRSNQSGVLPKAFMFGAAVVASAELDNEFVEDGVTGRLVRDRHDVAEIASAVEDIVENADCYGRACRSKFLCTFYYRSKLQTFLQLVGSRPHTPARTTHDA